MTLMGRQAYRIRTDASRRPTDDDAHEGGDAMLTLAASVVLAVAAAGAATDVESGLAQLLGDKSSDVPTVLAGLKAGMSPADARKVFPGLPASFKGQGYEPGRVE